MERSLNEIGNRNKIQTEDAEAFEVLFHTHCQPLIYFAYRYVRDKSIAEDVVQEAFVNIWKNRSRFDFSQNMKSYLYTSVKNYALKFLRHSEVRLKGVDQIQIRLGMVSTPDEVLDYKEIEQIVEQTIRELPEKCGQIFSMNRFDGLTYAEIAEILNISIKTVETQMSRALRFLRKRLAHFLISVV